MSNNADPAQPPQTAAQPVVSVTPDVQAVPQVDRREATPSDPNQTSKSQFKLKSVVKSKDVAHLVDLFEDLRAIATTTEDKNQLAKRFMDAVSTRGRMFGSAWVEFTNRGEGSIVESRFSNPGLNNQAMRQQLVESAMAVIGKSEPQILKSEKLRGSLFACVPFFIDDSTTAVICGIVQDDKHRCTESLAICQSVANHFDLWRSRDQLTSMAVEVRSTASVLELVGKVESCETLKDACVELANELQSYFRCDYVAVGLKKSSLASCRMTALSSMAEFDNQSRSTTLIQSAFDEAILRGQYTSFPAPPNKQSSPALSHKKLAQHMRVEAAITIPLRNQDEEAIGAVSIMGNRNLDRNPSTRNLINALEYPLGSCLAVVKTAQGGWLRKLQRMFISKEKTNTKWAALALALISLIAMFIPVSYRINANCTAEPVVRSFSVAPHDGLLETTFVEPGDTVSKGQILAKMDGREIGFQIADIVAQANQAATEHDSYLAHGEIAKSIESGLKRVSLEAELSILEDKQSNLKIKSTTDGVVLSGSIDKRENYPVTLGQTLYEIAPITPLRVELAIPADEVMHVQANQTVKFRFDGFGTETIEGIVERIRPSSTIRNDENVFIAEAVLENKDGAVRPGMNGSAKVYGKKRSLGWSLFHRPWEKIVTAVGF